MDWTTIIHVTGGGLALAMGAIALYLHKGSNQHRLAGEVFTGAMVVMAIPGGVISYVAGKPFDALSSLMALYMVLTGGVAFKGVSRMASAAMFASALACIAGYLSVEVGAVLGAGRATDAPVGMGYAFATFLTLAAWGDLRLQSGAYDRRQLMFRHLWRMNFGLFIATGSFFGARPHLFPDWMQTYGVLAALTFAPIAAMLYWRLRIRGRPAKAV